MPKNVTHREWEVAELISFGLTEKEISNHLGVSIHTVNSHKKNLFNKTRCRNIADVTRWYIQEASGIRIEPNKLIRKLISVFMLIILVTAEFSTSEFIRTRTRVRRIASTKTKTHRVRRSKETLYLQIA